MHLLLILFFRQLSRSFSKSGWIRLVWFITMTWFMQGCIIYYVKEYKMHPEVLETLNENMVIAIASICVSSFFFDFLFKLLFKHDATVMDAYLKTRPVTSNTWNRFLIVSQFWNPFNLLLPFLCIVGCFMLFHFAWGLLLFLLLYLISVANGTLVMLIKRGGTYDETKTETRSRLANWMELIMRGSRVKSRYVSSIHYISLLRVPRLFVEVIFADVSLFLLVWLQSHDEVFIWEHNLCIVGLFVCQSIFVGRYGLCIESSFYDGIWTKPLSLSRLLSDKYKTFGLITLPLVIPCILLIREEWVSWSRFLAFAIYGSGFGNMVMLTGAFNRKKFELFTKAFFELYSNKSYYHTYEFFIALAVFVVAIGLTFLPKPWMCDVSLTLIGAISFLLHEYYFKMVERLFHRNRYKHLSNYR